MTAIRHGRRAFIGAVLIERQRDAAPGHIVVFRFIPGRDPKRIQITGQSRIARKGKTG